MDWNSILTWGFLVALVTSGIRLAIPVMLATLGEVVTERGGVVNLGLEGVMIAGGLGGFMTAYFIQNSAWGASLPWAGTWLGLAAGILAGMAMGLILAVLCVTLHADQVVSGVTLVILGLGLTSYLYRQEFSSLTARVTGLPAWPIPGLARIPVIGDIFFNHDVVTYGSFLLVGLVWVFLYRTMWGQQIRAVGEHPAAADTSGVNVELTRYAAILIGTGLAGLGGAVLTVVQLRLFREGITAGRGWIAVALVIFARWRPELALAGALLFGLADSLQYRIQALATTGRGAGAIPYEFLLMLPYLLTLGVLLVRVRKTDAPAALGRPYLKGER
ncbi:MAG TPA: ABC transporter permease [Chloroflexi bacterium]|nr:ABC transporter permease [Chloroflexota bacterium]